MYIVWYNPEPKQCIFSVELTHLLRYALHSFEHTQRAPIITDNSQKCLQNHQSVLAKRKDRIASCGTAEPYFSGHSHPIWVSNNLLLIILRRAQLRQAIKEMTDIKPN